MVEYDENVYKKVTNTASFNIVIGIIVILFGITLGVLNIVFGSMLLSTRKNLIS